MAMKISKRYSSYKSQPNVFKLVLNFPRNDPHSEFLLAGSSTYKG